MSDERLEIQLKLTASHLRESAVLMKQYEKTQSYDDALLVSDHGRQLRGAARMAECWAEAISKE